MSVQFAECLPRSFIPHSMQFHPFFCHYWVEILHFKCHSPFHYVYSTSSFLLGVFYSRLYSAGTFSSSTFSEICCYTCMQHTWTEFPWLSFNQKLWRASLKRRLTERIWVCRKRHFKGPNPIESNRNKRGNTHFPHSDSRPKWHTIG